MQNGLKIFSDGGARGNPGPAACAVVFVKDGTEIFKGSKFLGEATNNVAEYHGVVFALEKLVENPGWVGGGLVIFFLDSELIVNQLLGKYKIKNQTLATLSLRAKELERKINGEIFYKHISRTANKVADWLVNEELDRH